MSMAPRECQKWCSKQGDGVAWGRVLITAIIALVLWCCGCCGAATIHDAERAVTTTAAIAINNESGGPTVAGAGGDALSMLRHSSHCHAVGSFGGAQV